MQKKSKTKIRPLQKQNKPGLEAKLSPLPESEPIQQNGKLKGKVYHLGYHETQKDALEARNKWAKDNNIPIQEWEEFDSEKDTKTDKKKVTTPRKKNGKRI